MGSIDDGVSPWRAVSPEWFQRRGPAKHRLSYVLHGEPKKNFQMSQWTL